jgi:hypothetical protein
MRALRWVVSVCLWIVIGANAAGCIFASDSSKRVVPTLGQELQDLHVAREKGSINDDEYAQAKNKLLLRGQH